MMENRFKMLTKSKPDQAKVLFKMAQQDAETRFRFTSIWRGARPKPDAAAIGAGSRRSVHERDGLARKDDRHGPDDEVSGIETAEPAGRFRLRADVGGHRQHQTRRRTRARSAWCSTRCSKSNCGWTRTNCTTI